MKLFHLVSTSILLVCICTTTNGLSQPSTTNSRRAVIKNGAAFGIASFFVALDPHSHAAALATDKDQQFVNVGQQAPPPDGVSAFTLLDNGVKVKDFKVGSGEELIQPNSQSVMVQATGRLLNLNGVIFYSTKNNNPDGFGAIPLTINLGRGEVIPGLESGLVGMKKGGIRR